jgi:membrane fusion protein (multidrug efflux system)
MNPPNGIDLPPRAADFRRLRATPAPAFRTIAGFMIACLAGLAMSGCTKPRAATGGAGPADVEVVQVAQSDVPIYGEWVGTLEGLVNADVKAQISGYLMKQAYTEGAFVRQGQLLFEIDARPFQAAVDQVTGQLALANSQVAQTTAQLAQAEAQLKVAEANQHRIQRDVERYTPLVKQEAVTQQDLDNASENNLAAMAQVQTAKAAIEIAKAQVQASHAAVQSVKAAMETASLNLGFTRLISPIDGIAGAAQQQVGNLVSPNSPAVATVSTLDPIKVFFTVSEREYLDYSKLFTASGSGAPLELVLANGKVYPHPGKFFFTDRQVNSTTGAIRLAGLFPNPGNVMRPGQYGRVRGVTSTKKGALLIPQRAVTELQGVYQVAVVNGENKVQIKTVSLGERVGGLWIVQSGLALGERVVSEGLQKVRPGSQVNPRPFHPLAATKDE